MKENRREYVGTGFEKWRLIYQISYELLFNPEALARRISDKWYWNLLFRVLNIISWVGIAMLIAWAFPPLLAVLRGEVFGLSVSGIQTLFAIVAFGLSLGGQIMGALLSKESDKREETVLPNLIWDPKHVEQKATRRYHPGLPLPNEELLQKSDHIAKEASTFIGDVMTFNVRALGLPSGYAKEGDRAETQEKARERAKVTSADIVRRAQTNPDLHLVALQEVDSKGEEAFSEEWLKALAKQLNEAQKGSQWQYIKSETDVAMLYDASKLQLESHSSDSIALDQTAIFQHMVSGKKVAVTNGHYYYEPFPDWVHQRVTSLMTPKEEKEDYRIDAYLVLMDGNRTSLEISDSTAEGDLQVNAVDNYKLVDEEEIPKDQGTSSPDAVIMRERKGDEWGPITRLPSKQINLETGEPYPSLRLVASESQAMTPRQQYELNRGRMLLTFEPYTSEKIDVTLDGKSESLTLQGYRSRLIGDEGRNLRCLIADGTASKSDVFSVAWASNLRSSGIKKGKFSNIGVVMPLRFWQELEQRILIKDKSKFQFDKVHRGGPEDDAAAIYMHKKDLSKFYQYFSSLLKECVERSQPDSKPVFNRANQVKDFDFAALKASDEEGGKAKKGAKDITNTSEIRDPFLLTMGKMIAADFYTRVAQHYWDNNIEDENNRIIDPFSNLCNAINICIAEFNNEVNDLGLSAEELNIRYAVMTQLVENLMQIAPSILEGRKQKLAELKKQLVPETASQLSTEQAKKQKILEATISSQEREFNSVQQQISQLRKCLDILRKKEEKEPRSPSEEGATVRQRQSAEKIRASKTADVSQPLILPVSLKRKFDSQASLEEGDKGLQRERKGSDPSAATMAAVRRNSSDGLLGGGQNQDSVSTQLSQSAELIVPSVISQSTTF